MPPQQIFDGFLNTYGIIGILGLMLVIGSYLATIITAVIAYIAYDRLRKIQIKLDILAAR